MKQFVNYFPKRVSYISEPLPWAYILRTYYEILAIYTVSWHK